MKKRNTLPSSNKSSDRQGRRVTTIRKQKAEAAEYIDILSFPTEIIMEILLRVACSTLVFLPLVCKTFYQLIRNPDFINEHAARARPRLLLQATDAHRITAVDLFALMAPHRITSHSNEHITVFNNLPLPTIDRNKLFALRTTCKGLLLLEHKSIIDRGIMIINPITRQHCRLPMPDPFARPFQESHFGFTFDVTAQRFKVVSLFSDAPGAPANSGILHCEVFTLGSDSWCRVPPPEVISPDISYLPVTAGGVVHWVDGYIQKWPRPVFDPSRHELLSMDITTEKFRRTKVPPDSSGLARVFEMCGKLGLICCTETRVDLWILEDPKRGMWLKKHSTNNSYLLNYLGREFLDFDFHPSASLNEGKIIIFKSINKVYKYDLDLEHCEEVKNSQSAFSRAPRYVTTNYPCVHVDTLVSF